MDTIIAIADGVTFNCVIVALQQIDSKYTVDYCAINYCSVDRPEQIDTMDITSGSKLQSIKIGAEMNLYNIYFETDSFRILPESESELQTLVGFLSNNSTLKVEIQGHTDNSGNSTKNQKLSELRAKSVADYLTLKGIKSVRLNSIGHGENSPVATNETEKGRTMNRRTTIKIIGK